MILNLAETENASLESNLPTRATAGGILGILVGLVVIFIVEFVCRGRRSGDFDGIIAAYQGARLI